MDTQKERRDKTDGSWYQTRGEFSWWSTSVRPSSPWPKEAPILAARNFFGQTRGSVDGPDRRLFDQWEGGFPYRKSHIVDEAVKKAIKEVTGRGIGGSYKVWMWADKQEAKTLAAVWNLAMRNLGYDA